MRKNGFTLIELVMVIVIISILAVVAIPKFVDLRADAKQASMNGIKGAGESGAQIWRAKFLIDTSGTCSTQYPSASASCFDRVPTVPSGNTLSYDSTTGIFTFTTG